MNKKSSISLGSLFDGIGGFPYAGTFFGIEPAWASEILPSAVSITRRNLPSMTHVGDITKLHGGNLKPVDIITFGSPCQGLSCAGKRLGLNDERSALFIEAIRIIREMREMTNGTYPRYALWENVPGALSSGKPAGSDFKAVLEAFTEAGIPFPRSGRWANAGMVRSGRADLAWCVYDSKYFGTAQRRRRIFLVADFGGGCAGEILFVPKSLRGYFTAGGTPRQGTAAYAAQRTGCKSFPGGCDFKKIGLAFLPLYDNGIICLNDQGGSSLCVEKSGQSPTLRSETHGNLPIVCHMAYVLQGTMIGQGKPSGSNGSGVNKEKCFTLTATDQHSIATVDCRNYRENEEISGTLQAKESGGYSLNCQNPVRIGENVRRLTPTECERLMGYPDGWTALDEHGKTICDSRRYQMLGNSIAVPCAAYILKGMVQKMEKGGTSPCKRKYGTNQLPW